MACVGLRIRWVLAVPLLLWGGLDCALQETEPSVLEQRLSAIERDIVDLKEVRLALAVFQLRMATQTHLPFERELGLVRQLSIREPENATVLGSLEAIAPYAANGVATPAELRDSFGLLVFPKLQPLLGVEKTWGEWARGWVSAIMAPIASSTAKPMMRQQLVMAAMDHLSEDDLAAAVAELSKLDGPAASVAVHWLHEANARLAVDVAYTTLSGWGLVSSGQMP